MTSSTTNAYARSVDDIRRHSDAYGMRVCIDHAHVFGVAIGEWRKGRASAAAAVPVRVYSRTQNAMRMETLATVLDHFVLDASGAPARLTPTHFGQVVLHPDVVVPTVLYHTLVATWYATPKEGSETGAAPDATATTPAPADDD